MTEKNDASVLKQEILEKIREFGADLVGIADPEALKNGPSETLFPMMKDHSRDHFAQEITTGLSHGSVFWEPDAASVIVYAIHQPSDQPELDWWCGEIDPPGNKKLLMISRLLKEYLAKKYPFIHVYPKRYHVERGGLYLKEAAVAAGLGCIGRNNLLVTPRFGPRVRLRAVVISEKLPPDGPSGFDPCTGCPAPCIASCPRKAFSRIIYTPDETGLIHLPGRDGSYYRADCNQEMLKNEDEAVEGVMPEVCDHPEKIIKYCRNCEMNCRIGKP